MTPETPADFAPRVRVSYRFFSHLPVRFGDQDVMGHVNNTAIGAYFEHARCEHLVPRVLSAEHPTLNIVLARIVIDYLREVLYPNTVDVGVRVSRVGDKSLVISGGLFVGETCHATADATIVFFDSATRRSTVPPASVRARISELR